MDRPRGLAIQPDAPALYARHASSCIRRFLLEAWRRPPPGRAVPHMVHWRIIVSLSLGPMPENVRAIVGRLVAEAQQVSREKDERINGFLLDGGPGSCCFLSADGEVWRWWSGDESIQRVEDGPVKVGIVAIAAERVAGLAEWLPPRPAAAQDCQTCMATGWIQRPELRFQCPKCFGMGWCG
jgi:hypothetical protein